ncbi:MAG: hypothetical protein RhofKO_12060 [Rhodothermales bacterium]
MRNTLSLICFLLVMAFATPGAQAQFKADRPALQTSTRLYDAGAQSALLNKLFSPETFKMSHSLEFSTGSHGSLGMYTNSMMWQFNDKLAARVDLALAYSPDGGGDTFGIARTPSGFGQNNGKVFLRNAEIAYRPTENTRLHLSVRQSPYGSYMNPYGSGYGGYGYRPARSASMHLSFGDEGDRLFWRNSR